MKKKRFVVFKSIFFSHSDIFYYVIHLDTSPVHLLIVSSVMVKWSSPRDLNYVTDSAKFVVVGVSHAIYSRNSW